MVQSILNASLLLAIASFTTAQGPPNGNPFSGDNDPFSSSGDTSPDDNSFSDSSFGDFGPGTFGPPSGTKTIITAHAILATLAFGLFLPSGGILIRLASFRGLWIVHGVFQILASLPYIAAFGLGIWMATHARLMQHKHPIIGIVCLVLLFFQPFLGLIHHFAFKKSARRVFWSYAHVWLGRCVITLGIINGGLGLQLAERLGHFVPSRGAVVGYSVGAGVVWIVYVFSAVYGERKRRRAIVNRPPEYSKAERGSDDVRSA